MQKAAFIFIQLCLLFPGRHDRFGGLKQLMCPIAIKEPLSNLFLL